MPTHQCCPVCLSDAIKPHFHVDGFDIDRCQDCTLIFVRQILSTAQLKPYYQISDSVYEDPSNTVNLDFYYKRLKRLIEQRSPARGRLLDVGCSRGQFIDQMSGWDAYGIELNESDADFARKRHGSRIHHGTLSDFEDPEIFFDVITMLDSFDHMQNPRETLAHCRCLLKPGGYIVIKVHDISCLYARVTGKHFYAILPPYHLYYYSQKTLRLLLESSGFRFLSARHIGHRLFLKNIPYRLARGKTHGLTYQLYRVLDRSPLGCIPIYKNLNDIITVLACREGVPS